MKKFSFEGTTIELGQFSDCELQEASFKGCNLKETSFQDCQLLQANFAESYGFLIDLTQNKVRGARFSSEHGPVLLSSLGIHLE